MYGKTVDNKPLTKRQKREHAAYLAETGRQIDTGTSVLPGASKGINLPTAQTNKRRPGGGRKRKGVTLVNRGNDIALNAFPEAMQAAVERALGGTYPALCTKCGAKIEVNVPGDKELLKLVIERGGGKVTTGTVTPGEGSGELTNGQLVRYSRMIQDWMDSVANTDTRDLEREVARAPEQPVELEGNSLPYDQTAP